MTKKMISWLACMAVFLFILQSCRTDLEASAEHKTELGGHLHQKISSTVFRKETFLTGINDFKREANALSSKSGMKSDYLKRFSIDESSIYKMDVNNTQTYALRAYNIFESPETIYNLVYRKSGNNITFSIVRISDKEIIPVYDSQKGIVTKTDNPAAARTCTDFYSVEIWHCKEGVSWSQCDKCSNCLFTSSGYTSYECGGGGGGSTGGGGTAPGGGDGGGGGGTGLYDPSGYTFDPNVPASIEPSYVRAVRASNFFSQQTDQAKSWAVEHADIYCSILEYYLDHIPPSSPPPNSYYQDFANFAIQFLMEHPEISWEEFESLYINNPCSKIKDWFNNPKFKEKFDKLTKTSPTNVFDLDRELVAYMRYPTLGTNLPPAFVDINLPSCATDGNLPNFEEGMGGLMHTHNNVSCSGGTPIKVPSPTDIQTFINVLMRESMQYTNSYQNAYSLVATSGGNYLLIYSGTNYPGSINYDSWKQLQTDYERDYNKLYEENENVTQIDIEKIFTKFMKEKVNKLGLEVYKVTPSSRVKIEYDPNSPNSVKQTPCP